MMSYVEQRDFAGSKNFIFYISRFPEYRNSYVLVQSGFDGLWRSFCFHNDDSSIEPICLDGANTPEDARKLMKHSDRKQFYIRVMHSGCFECIDCRKVGIKR